MNKTFDLINVFEDDREPCCNFTYKGKQFSLWWTNVKLLYAMEYTDSPSAQELLAPLALALNEITETGASGIHLKDGMGFIQNKFHKRQD